MTWWESAHCSGSTIRSEADCCMDMVALNLSLHAGAVLETLVLGAW